MGVLTFRTPQEGLDQFQKATDLMSLIREIASNPKVGETIQDLSKQLSNAQQMSDDKKKEVYEAEEVIAQSKDILDELATQKADQDKKFNSDMATIQQSLKNIELDKNAVAVEKANNQTILDKNNQETQKAVAEAKIAIADAVAAKLEAERLQKEMVEKEIQLQKDKAEFETIKSTTANEFAAKTKNLETSLAKLAEDQAAFEARKKRFEDVLKA